MKLRMLAALVTFSFFVPLSPAWAQRADLPGLDGVWYSCADPKDRFDIMPEKGEFISTRQGKVRSGKYKVEGNQLKFAGRTLAMTDGEFDEGSTHWVNGSPLLATRCPGVTSQSQAALTGAGAAIPEQPEIKDDGGGAEFRGGGSRLKRGRSNG